jgi:hypothetical protein
VISHLNHLCCAQLDSRWGHHTKTNHNPTKHYIVLLFLLPQNVAAHFIPGLYLHGCPEPVLANGRSFTSSEHGGHNDAARFLQLSSLTCSSRRLRPNDSLVIESMTMSLAVTNTPA